MDDIDLGATIRGYSAGQKVFGRFTLKKILGRGGMGVVWLARDEKLDEELALKFLPDIVKHDPAALDELKAETKRARRLTHAGIVRIHDFLEDAHAAAIAMEAVEGVTLSQFRIEQPGKLFEVAAVAAWVRQICSALDYAHHTARVVHRDLKPANLMVDATGRIKVTDFGIARSISDSVSRVSAQAGSSGTPAYMSPQQMLGEKPAVTDDVYALGATIYELLTGKPPFYSGNVMMQVQSKVPPSLGARRAELEISGAPIPPEWEAVVAACLLKAAGERPPSVAEVARRLGLDDGSFTTKGTQAGGPLVPQLPADLDAGETMKFGREAARPSQTAGQLATEASVKPVPGSKGMRWVAAIVAVLMLSGAGYYFGIYGPEQKRIASEQARVMEEKRLAEERKTALAEQEKKAAAEEKRRVIAAEDMAYQDIGRLVLGLAESAPKADFESVQKAVESYLVTAPQRYQASVASDWDKKAKAWLAYGLAHRPGSLVVETDPPGATVILYPANIRKSSPAVFKDINPGEDSIRVEKEGYEAQDVSLEIKPGEEKRPGLLRLISLTGSAVITSEPAGAKVSLDGNSRHFEGVTPFRQEQIPPGTYRATFQRSNWRPVEKSLTVKRNESANLTADLHGVGLELRSDPSGAQVSLNGSVVGTTPLQLTDQAPGEYNLVMNLAGFDPATKRVTAERSTEVSLALLRTMPKITRLVFFRKKVIYVGSATFTLKIDGAAAGKLANGSYWVKQLPPGVHAVAASLLGMEAGGRQVELQEGETTYLEWSPAAMSAEWRAVSKSEALGAIGILKLDASSPDKLDLPEGTQSVIRKK